MEESTACGILKQMSRRGRKNVPWGSVTPVGLLSAVVTLFTWTPITVYPRCSLDDCYMPGSGCWRGCLCMCVHVHACTRMCACRPSAGRDKQQTDMSCYEKCPLESKGGDGLRTACWFGENHQQGPFRREAVDAAGELRSLCQGQFIVLKLGCCLQYQHQLPKHLLHTSHFPPEMVGQS